MDLKWILLSSGWEGASHGAWLDGFKTKKMNIGATNRVSQPSNRKMGHGHLLLFFNGLSQNHFRPSRIQSSTLRCWVHMSSPLSWHDCYVYPLVNV